MTPDFETFRDTALADGFYEVVERRWEPGSVVATHSHPFAANALVVQGEMWLTVAGGTQHLKPGDRFALAAGVPHEERYGPQGATYWVARR
jgi:quercetin dioxygenase-like cupin family protein